MHKAWQGQVPDRRNSDPQSRPQHGTCCQRPPARCENSWHPQPASTIIRSPALWHFNFRGPDVERLVQGRERIYLDRFWNELSANSQAIDEATRAHYAELYARPGAMHSAFEQFAAFAQDAIDNKAFAAAGKLAMPVLAIGADKSFGTAQADGTRFVASDVTGLVIPNSGHWLMEEQPEATVEAIRKFLHKQ